jgi:hypothetical protein
MERLRNLIKEALSTPLKKDKCNCGCHDCDNVGNAGVVLNESVAPKEILSENLRYHVVNKFPLTENTFRYGSESFLNLWAEARALYLREIIHVNDDDKEILEETDLGNYGLYEGVKVPLDLLMLNEEGEDTSWTDEEGNKVTLQDILDLTKDIPQEDYPTEKLAKIVLNWDDNPEEIERINQVEVSKQYPILIMVNEEGKIQWILDGNHRAQKALQSKSKTIPAKLIKPSNLDAKAKKILLGVVDENILNESEGKKKNPPIGKPKRGGSKKFYVYVRKPGGGVKKVSFGDTTGLSAKISNPKARKAFAARHDCKNKTDRTKASYWSCRLPRYSKLLGLKSSFSGFW